MPGCGTFMSVPEFAERFQRSAAPRWVQAGDTAGWTSLSYMMSGDASQGPQEMYKCITIHVCRYLLCVDLHTLLPTWALPNRDRNIQHALLSLSCPSGHFHFLTDNQTPDGLLRPSCGSPSEFVVSGFETSLILLRQQVFLL